MNRKTLNVNNSYRSDNCYLFLKEDITGCTPLSEYTGTIDDDSTYIIDLTKENDVPKAEQLLREKPHVLLINDGVIPPNFLFAMGNNRESRTFMYYKDEFSKSETDNLRTYGQISQNGVIIPVTSCNFNCHKVVFSLNDFKYYLDNAIFMFDKDIPSDYKLELYSKLHEILARWRIRMCISANDETELEFLNSEYEKYI